MSLTPFSPATPPSGSPIPPSTASPPSPENEVAAQQAAAKEIPPELRRKMDDLAQCFIGSSVELSANQLDKLSISGSVNQFIDLAIEYLHPDENGYRELIRNVNSLSSLLLLDNKRVLKDVVHQIAQGQLSTGSPHKKLTENPQARGLVEIMLLRHKFEKGLDGTLKTLSLPPTAKNREWLLGEKVAKLKDAMGEGERTVFDNEVTMYIEKHQGRVQRALERLQTQSPSSTPVRLSPSPWPGSPATPPSPQPSPPPLIGASPLTPPTSRPGTPLTPPRPATPPSPSTPTEALLSPKREVTNENFRDLLVEFQEYKKNNKEAVFALFLLNKGLDPSLNHVDFRQEGVTTTRPAWVGRPIIVGSELLKGVDFTGITFKNCDFNWVNMSDSNFSNCRFENCDMKNGIFAGCKFNNCTIDNCRLYEAYFDDSTFENSNIINSNLEYASFFNSHLKDSTISNCRCPGTSFFRAQVSNCHIVKSELTDCLFFNTKNHFFISECTPNVITRPVIGMLWNIHDPGVTANKAIASLKTENAIPVRVNYALSSINAEKLKAEVREGINSVKPGPDVMSIPDELLKQNAQKDPKRQSEISKIDDIARDLAAEVDAILLPGGADVEPEFYGQESEPRTKPHKDYKRTIFEFALLKEARAKTVPLMGICRGSQVGNIYYGGTLKQHVDNQLLTIQKYTPQLTTGLVGKTLGPEAFHGMSVHHQSMEKIGHNLEVVIDYNGIPKALQDKSGAPLMLIQFHPEFRGDEIGREGTFLSNIMGKQNQALFSTFMETAQEYRQKKAAAKHVTVACANAINNIKLAFKNVAKRLQA